VAIVILVAMPLVAVPFEKAGTVVLAELVSLVVTVCGAVLRQRLNDRSQTPMTAYLEAPGINGPFVDAVWR
jgi:hypothetical protein